jgi:hypothetical protein
MMADENTRPQNTLVAESDLQASLKAIDAVFSHEKYLQKDENGEIAPIFQQARESVSSSLQNLVQPISDAAYYQHVSRYNETEEQDSDFEDDDDDDDDESVQEEQEDFSFEEDELVDEDVLERAQVLRNQVRLASQRVDMLRTSVTNRAVSVAQREAALLVGEKEKDEKPLDAATIQERLSSTNQNTNTRQLKEMKESLENLNILLQEMKTQVPETMEMLQETIDVIHETATKQQSQQSLSQTERAIISRSNEGPSQISQQEKDTAPDARLATFLGQH